MVTNNGIQTYACSEEEVHSGCTTKDQCTQVAILWMMEWIQGPKARKSQGDKEATHHVVEDLRVES